MQRVLFLKYKKGFALKIFETLEKILQNVFGFSFPKRKLKIPARKTHFLLFLFSLCEQRK
jgi:hypothetical protein